MLLALASAVFLGSLVAPIIFEITPLHGHHGKHRLKLLRMHVYSFVA
jgi:hypothetical protein